MSKIKNIIASAWLAFGAAGLRYLETASGSPSSTIYTPPTLQENYHEFMETEGNQILIVMKTKKKSELEMRLAATDLAAEYTLHALRRDIQPPFTIYVMNDTFETEPSLVYVINKKKEMRKEEVTPIKLKIGDKPYETDQDDTQEFEMS